MPNPIADAQGLGQSIWYDNIRRGLITSGELQAMVDRDGLMGVTSNPSIFEKAVVGSTDYEQALRALVRQGVGDAKDIYERLAIEDIQLAADIMYPVYQRTGGRDGFVSFEVSPYLARDTAGTIEEAVRLHAAVGRDNVMMKVPATPQGIPAITDLISRGINVNVTLLFAVEMYQAAAEAYVKGLETRAARSQDISRIHSVASFFVSRIDSWIDDRVMRALDSTHDPERRHRLDSMLGKVAIANARLAYEQWRDLTAGARWKALADKGAWVQRLLWASTSTKNPKYPKTLYVDELIGADTVNTVPEETYKEFKKSGHPSAALTANWEEQLAQAKATIAALAEAGTSLKEATDFLLEDGVKKFSEAFDQLLAAVEKKRLEVLGDGIDRLTYSIDKEVATELKAVLNDWRAAGKVRRLWTGDSTLWTGRDEEKWLDWLYVVDGQREHSEHLARLAQATRGGAFKHVVLLGMGGSSLCPDVLRHTFGTIQGYPELLVLDSTVPAQVKAVADRIDPAATLFVVSSKSGTTTEPLVFKQFFMERAAAALGSAAKHFVAITDPGTPLDKMARDEGFAAVFHGVPGIGGRYSALSNFGMAPAAAMGLNYTAFLNAAEVMVQSCAAFVPPDMNPGVTLGALMATAARHGRDKVTLVTSPQIATLGTWLEQLLAESTGKQGKGLIPIAAEKVGAPAVYGGDRLFVYLRLEGGAADEQDAAVAALEKAGHPVVRIAVHDRMELGQEFFRWEVATATAGAILGINAFDQPDVEASKEATRRLVRAYEQSGALTEEKPLVASRGLALFADSANARELSAKGAKLEQALAAHLARLGPGDYFAITAYLEMSEANSAALQALRHKVRDARKVATTLGFGPRFLHSTGQLHKGGPNSGVFLQITSDDAADLPIPGHKYTFGVLKRFQAQGDFEVLSQRQRRALRVHLGADVGAALTRLNELVASAL